MPRISSRTFLILPNVRFGSGISFMSGSRTCECRARAASSVLPRQRLVPGKSPGGERFGRWGSLATTAFGCVRVLSPVAMHRSTSAGPIVRSKGNQRSSIEASRLPQGRSNRAVLLIANVRFALFSGCGSGTESVPRVGARAMVQFAGAREWAGS
jgi:hypothetical protein